MAKDESKMTLRHCASDACCVCPECGTPYCRETIASLAEQVICRKDLEIEKYREGLLEIRETLLKLKDSAEEDIRAAKLAAYREFAEDLIRKAKENADDGYNRVVYPSEIIALLKEKEEEMGCK